MPNQVNPQRVGCFTEAQIPWRSACAAAALALLASCGGGSGGGAAVVAPSVAQAAEIPTKALYQIVLVSALDDSRITDPITITFTGTPVLLDSEGKALNAQVVTTSDGFLSFGAQFTSTAKDFSVQAGNRALGWTETGTRVVGDPAVSATQTITLKLLNTRAAAAVTADTSKGISSTTTVVQNFTAPVTVASVPKTITTPEGRTVTMGTASLAIPANTTAVDSTGRAITTTGALTVSTTLFSSDDTQALTAFPGGFAPRIDATSTGPAAGSSTGVFVTGGFAQFNVTDASGKALKTFDKPLTLTIDLPKSTLDPSGLPVAVGGIFPVWSYDDATGQWKFERDGVIQEKTPPNASNFQVVFTSTHLSSWNLDYFQQSCLGKVTLTGRGTDTRPLRVDVLGIPGRPYAYQKSPVTDSVMVLYNSPSEPLSIKVYDGTTLVGQSSTPATVCGAGQTVAVNLPAASTGGVRVNITEACSNGANQRPLPTWVYLEQAPLGFQGNYATVSGTSAQATFTDRRSGAAKLWVFNRHTSSYVQQAITIPTGSTLTIPFNFTMPCAGVTGAS